jgi:5-methylcytosine-specific restriction enzyme subunit McrC
MPNISYEYQKVDKAFQEYIQETPHLHKYFKNEWGVIKARQYCGIINDGKQDFYLLPKITKNNDTHNLDIFIYMLRYVYDIKLKNEDFSSSKNHSTKNFLEVFIQMFAKNLFKEFQKGVYKEYVTCKDNLTILRGKYLINENLKYNHTKDKIYCEFDEFSMDNKLNQFFLFALKTFIPFLKDTKLLKQCELILDEVTCKQIDINFFSLNFHRLNARYKDSYEFAIILLKKFIPLFQDGKKSFAFLFDMNELFEKFIGKIYEDIDKSTELQKTKIYGNLVLKPDIYTSTCIIDTKYKKVKSKDDLNKDDKYQMFVYGTNFEIKHTMLLYPKHLLHVKEDLKLGKGEKLVNLKMRSVDLDFNGGYSEYIKEMKKRLEEIGR